MKRIWLILVLLLMWTGFAVARLKPPAGTLIKPGHPLSRGLVAAYPFNTGFGDTLYDYAPGKPWADRNHGTLNGPSWVPGRDGWALDFNNNDVILPGGVSFKGRDKFTISIWVIADTLIGYDSIYYESIGGSAGARIYIFTNNGTLIFGGRAPDASGFGTWNTYSTLLSTGQLYHIVAVYNASEVSGFRQKLYVNGVVNNSGTEGDAITDVQPLNIQIGRFGTVQPWDGRIDKVHTYFRALSAAEIMQLYLNSYAAFQQQQVLQWFVEPSVGVRRIILVH